MLWAVKDKSSAIVRVERRDNRLYLYAEAGIHRLEPKNDRTVRISFARERFSDEGELGASVGEAVEASLGAPLGASLGAPLEKGGGSGEALSQEDWEERIKPGVIRREVWGDWEYEETEESICLRLKELQISICRETGSYRYLDGEGRLLLRERERDSKTLEEFTVYEMLEEGSRVETVATPDGEKQVVREAARRPVGKSFHTRLSLEWGEEALYGLGQQEEGFGSLRGQMVFLHQANRKIAIPMLVSTKGYGILTDTYSPMIFSDTAYGSYLYTEADPEMDYYFMNGGTMDGVVREYRFLTGKAALLPKWAYGYLQSQERYETQKEILQVAREHRERGIGLDCLVLDWCSWEDGKWGQKSFDPARFPDPGEMIRGLHAEHIHFMISVWPNMDPQGENYREFAQKGLFLPGCQVYNALKREARELYWRQLREGLYRHGVDGWWCDNSEPFAPEWGRRERVEPAVMYGEYCREAGCHLPAERMNAYGLFHARAIWEGQRREGEMRVVNLTRSACTGQQRYGTVLWSGDTEACWETLRRQVAAGLHFCASGLPFWTVDIGAFFVKRGDFWYWRGEYEGGTKDLGYGELFVRWFQWACFLPVFRGHGTDCRRELWQFENAKAPFYEVLLSYNRLRYRLMPYLYSLAGRCWLEDGSMIRLLAFGYPQDTNVWNITDQYLLGEDLMVCPVLVPMYYERGSRPLAGTEKSRRVYLPAGTGWYDYWTDAYYEGGQWIRADAPLEKIPLFVREGAVLPLGEAALSTQELSPALQVKVYPGRDGEFLLYEDQGEDYGYEKGQYRLTRLIWRDQERRLESRVTEPMAAAPEAALASAPGVALASASAAVSASSASVPSARPQKADQSPAAPIWEPYRIVSVVEAKRPQG